MCKQFYNPSHTSHIWASSNEIIHLFSLRSEYKQLEIPAAGRQLGLPAADSIFRQLHYRQDLYHYRGIGSCWSLARLPVKNCSRQQRPILRCCTAPAVPGLSRKEPGTSVLALEIQNGFSTPMSQNVCGDSSVVIPSHHSNGGAAGQVRGCIDQAPRPGRTCPVSPPGSILTTVMLTRPAAPGHNQQIDIVHHTNRPHPQRGRLSYSRESQRKPQKFFSIITLQSWLVLCLESAILVHRTGRGPG